MGLLTLPDRFSVYEGTIRAFAYPPRSIYSLRGYDSWVCLPSQIVSRFPRVRFARLLTLPDRFSVYEGTIRTFAYPPRSINSLRGYDSSGCLPQNQIQALTSSQFRKTKKQLPTGQLLTSLFRLNHFCAVIGFVVLKLFTDLLKAAFERSNHRLKSCRYSMAVFDGIFACIG